MSTFDPAAPPTAVGKGWWQNVDCPADYRANVTAQLQTDTSNPSGSWRNVGSPDTVYGVPEGKKATRANARFVCTDSNPNELYLWRSVIDVDIVGHADDANKALSNIESLPCRPDGVPTQ